ncbi:twin-arginine translocation signal domain-containing protein [Fontisphaera persica]|uniref:twin-arginine translocation signal domain-containing protein n=1 Tax=Fontisphaera persica TaxID=2974023 RepID=UPI0024C0D08F|nr:twin-arginine translocation signal domain-containing protein [Fontisphaera persica]WCJ59635.1 twin-arginine translocation signal domain-containing protein [Fontisphaera persica]
MKQPPPQPHESAIALTRRGFLGALAGSAATATVGAAPAPPSRSNPYEYKVDHLFKTDPKHLLYDTHGTLRLPVSDGRRVAVGPENQIWVSAGKTLLIFTSGLEKLREIQALDVIRALAVDADGTVYVAVKDHVEVFDPQGRRREPWNIPAANTWFTGIAVAEKDVFAADARNRVVLRYDKSGRLLGRLGEKDTSRKIPGLIVPSPFLDVEVAPDGLLRVTNPGRHLVETYTFDGSLVGSWGKTSMGVEGFCGCCNPINIAMLSDGRCITCEKGIPRVKRYSAKGEFEGVVVGPESFPEGLRTGAVFNKWDGSMAGVDAATDRQGRVLVLDQASNTLRIMVPKKPAATT